MAYFEIDGLVQDCSDTEGLMLSHWYSVLAK